MQTETKKYIYTPPTADMQDIRIEAGFAISPIKAPSSSVKDMDLIVFEEV